MLIEALAGLLSKIIARGSSNISSAAKTAAEIAVRESPTKYGSQGRLEIPELAIGVPLYDTTTGSAQKIVDDENSAAYLFWGDQIAIADHSSQANFNNLNNAVPSRTTAYIVRPGRTERYVCAQTQIGHIKIGSSGNQIYDCKWRPVYQQNRGRLTIYTCIQKSAQDVMDVRLTYWAPT